jgi:hypothetical protein
MNLLKAGGWMIYNQYITLKKKRGFTIIESLVYIFLTTIILVQGINLFVLMYKSYIETVNLTIKYNNCQNFYINLDDIICEGQFDQIIVDDKYILFSKDTKSNDLEKIIKSYEGRIVIKYMRANVTQTINTMLEDIDELEIKKKGKLIYLIIYDKDGKAFIRCI